MVGLCSLGHYIVDLCRVGPNILTSGGEGTLFVTGESGGVRALREGQSVQAWALVGVALGNLFLEVVIAAFDKRYQVG